MCNPYVIMERNSMAYRMGICRNIFDVVLAAAAHYKADHDITLTLVALVLLLASYFFGKEIRPMYR